MKKYKKLISMIITLCVFAGVVFIALYFMGIINPTQDGNENNENEEVRNYSVLDDGTDNEKNDIEEPWKIVFKGFEFLVKPMGQAIIHESGCLNIRNCDEYLIQIDVEDRTVTEFWENREEKINNIETSGYVMQLAPEKIDIDGREYIRYIVSFENERGSDFDNSYFYVLISEASEGKRFLATVRFDGIDVALLDTEERDALYEKALIQTTEVISSAHSTDKNDDATGTYWEEQEPMAYLSEDSLSADEITISYRIPEGYNLMSDNEAGKTYYSEEDQTHVITSIIPYSWITAEEMAESKNSAGISKILTEGKYEINGLDYYYYTYSVMFMEDDEKSYSYHFYTYTDLENGDIYSIHGFTDTNAEIINEEYYYDFMNIEQTGNY